MLDTETWVLHEGPEQGATSALDTGEPVKRAVERIARHLYVHTLFTRHSGCAQAEVTVTCGWDEVPQRAHGAAAGALQPCLRAHRVSAV